MIKTIQILKYMTANGYNFNHIMDELHEIIDNGRSDLFELTDADIVSISDIFFDEDKFASALSVVGIL